MSSKIFIIITGLIFGQLASAASPEVSAFRQFKDVSQLSVTVPTVVEVPFDQEFIERFDFAVLDKNTDTFQPYYFRQKSLINQIPFTVSSDNNSNPPAMVDGSFQTYTEFLLPPEGPGSGQINITSAIPITSSSLSLLLDNYVALPTSIEIQVFDRNQGQKIVLAETAMTQETIRFPQTSSTQWIINLNYSQPLRIAELRLAQENTTQVSADALRFLAQPNHQYSVYFNPDRQVFISLGESPNLANDQDIFRVPFVSAQNNPFFVMADTDGDSVPDVRDNCVSNANANQADVNANGRGDACDDFDRDGLINALDNCPDQPNSGQQDTDSDKIGDACDNEESRLTERLPWLPWVGIGFAAVVLIVLFATALKSGIQGPE